MAAPAIRVLENTACQAGEGILWCPRRQRLFWVDIAGRALWSGDPASDARTRWPMPDQPGCIALTGGDALVVALPDGLHLFDPESAALTPLAALPADAPEGHRANDGAVSRAGRFHFGTMTLGDRSIASGSLYVWAGAEVAPQFGGLHIVNGLAFSPDDRVAYVSDSYADVQTVWRFAHDPATGALTDRQVFFDTRDGAGRPDGACVDVDGCYWMAGVGGSVLLRLTPAGRVDLRIEVPVTWPSKPCFGGPGLGTIYLTSLRIDPESDRPDGQVIEIRTGHQGLPEPHCTQPDDAQ